MAISSLQPFAGIGITYARREEAEAERQHENVQHGMFLCDWSRECDRDREAEPVALAFDDGEVPPVA
jgi:hypothetical protein